MLPTQTERGRLSLATKSESGIGNNARIYRFLSAVALKRRLISLALNDYLTSCSSLPVKLSRMLSRSTISWLLSTSSGNENIQLSISILVFQTLSTSPPITTGKLVSNIDKMKFREAVVQVRFRDLSTVGSGTVSISNLEDGVPRV